MLKPTKRILSEINLKIIVCISFYFKNIQKIINRFDEFGTIMSLIEIF